MGEQLVSVELKNGISRVVKVLFVDGSFKELLDIFRSIHTLYPELRGVWYLFPSIACSGPGYIKAWWHPCGIDPMPLSILSHKSPDTRPLARLR